MTEWNVVLVVGEVLALFLLVGKPLINLNTTIATLKASLDALASGLKTQKDEFASFTAKSEKEHADTRDHLEKHEIALADHEFRLKILEKE